MNESSDLFFPTNGLTARLMLSIFQSIQILSLEGIINLEESVTVNYHFL